MALRALRVSVVSSYLKSRNLKLEIEGLRTEVERLDRECFPVTIDGSCFLIFGFELLISPGGCACE